MKVFSGLLAAVVLLAGFTGFRRVMAPSDLWLVYTAAVSGVGGNSDSVVVTAGVSGNPAIRRVYAGNGATDSILFVNARPPANSTISGSISATAYRRGLASATTTKPWSYTEPDVAPAAPSVTVTAKPGS